MISELLELCRVLFAAVDRLRQEYRGLRATSSRRETLILYYTLHQLCGLCQEMVRAIDDQQRPLDVLGKRFLADQLAILTRCFVKTLEQIRALDVETKTLEIYVPDLVEFCFEPFGPTRAVLGGAEQPTRLTMCAEELLKDSAKIDDFRNATAILAAGVQKLREFIRTTMTPDEVRLLTRRLPAEITGDWLKLLE